MKQLTWWVISPVVSATLVFVCIFAFARANQTDWETSAWYALGSACIGLTIHRLAAL